MKRPMLSINFNEDRLAERIDAMRERERKSKAPQRKRFTTADFVLLNGRKYVAGDTKAEAEAALAVLFAKPATGGGE